MNRQKPSRTRLSARVYVSMSDSEFRRWARDGSNHFWRNSVAIFSNSLLHTALNFANDMIAEHTNPRRSRSLTKWVEPRLDLVSPGKLSPLHRGDCVVLRTSSWIPLCVCISHMPHAE
jgi:hypothetical protein